MIQQWNLHHIVVVNNTSIHDTSSKLGSKPNQIEPQVPINWGWLHEFFFLLNSVEVGSIINDSRICILTLFYIFCFLQHCKEVGVDEYSDFIHLVGVWILLDCFRWASTSARFSPSLLVRAMRLDFEGPITSQHI